MNDNRKRFSGVYTALITPFTQNGEVNVQSIHTLMQKNIAQGVKGFFVAGSSGECFMLTERERLNVLEASIQAKGRAMMFAHVGAISTAQAITFANEARKMGYDAIAATPPFYYGFGSREICRYYNDISQAASMPVLIYNFPGNTGKKLDTQDENYRALLKSGCILGVKHTSLDLYALERLRNCNPDLVLFNGYDETTLAALALGADGSIGSTFNFMYPHYNKIYELYSDNKLQEAMLLQVKANNIMETLCKIGLIPSIKYIVTKLGIFAGNARAPFCLLSAQEQLTLDQILDENLCN